MEPPAIKIDSVDLDRLVNLLNKKQLHVRGWQGKKKPNNRGKWGWWR